MLQLRANDGYLTWYTNKLGTSVTFPFFPLFGAQTKANHKQGGPI